MAADDTSTSTTRADDNIANANADTDTAAAAAAAADAPTSQFILLPPEIRLFIYGFVLASTRLTFGKRVMDNNNTARAARVMRPRRHSLALLHVCRLIYREIRDLWPSRVLFNFEDPRTLLDKLAPLPSATVARIRRLRVWARSLWFRTDLQPEEGGVDALVNNLQQGGPPGGGGGGGDGAVLSYNLTAILKLVPALHLDVLTVFCSSDDRTAWQTLTGLIKKGNGWRQLNFVTPNSAPLMWALIHRRDEPDEQGDRYRIGLPITWEEHLYHRDGGGEEDSGASVTIYRAVTTAAAATTTPPIFCPETRQLFNEDDILYQDTIPSSSSSQQQQQPPPPTRMPYTEWDRELLVVVKRGRNANIVEPETPSDVDMDDIRAWSRGMAWSEIRERVLSSDDDNADAAGESLGEADVDIEEDSYDDVEEYEWPRLLRGRRSANWMMDG